MKKRIFLAVFLLLMTAALCAQIRMQSSVNKTTLYQNEMVMFTLRISSNTNDKPSSIHAPSVEGLRFVNQSSSQQSRFSITNGRSERSYIYTYDFYYYPTRSGRITIPSQSVKLRGQTYTSSAIRIEVLPSTAPQPGGYSYDPHDYYFAEPEQEQGESLILCLPESQTVYRSEPAIVSYYIYTTEDVRSFNLSDEQDFEGYGKAIYKQPTNLVFERADYMGKSYKRSLLKRLVLYPHSTGLLRAPQMAGTIRKLSYTYENRYLKSNDATIQVRELPPGAPAGYGGAIGTFTISEKLSSDTIKQGEAALLTIQINGQGNFSQFSSPLIPNDDRIQVSSPQIKDQVNAGTTGTRTLQYTIVPKVKGDIRLPQFRFSWLDSASGKYLVFTGKEMILSVKAGSGQASSSNLEKMLDEYTMRPMLERESYASFGLWYHRWWFWGMIALMLLSLPASLVIARRRSVRIKNPQLWAQKQAAGRLETQLALAKSVAAKTPSDFYALAEGAILDYLRLKYNLPAHLAMEELLVLLPQEDFSSELLSGIRSFLSDTQVARYAITGAPQHSIDEAQKRFKRIVAALIKAGRIK